MDFDTNVKWALYGLTAKTARMPSAAEVARAVTASTDEVIAAFGRLHKKRLLVPEPSDPSRIRMAPPFSGVATEFLVHADGKSYFANCVWDAYGVAAAMHADAVIDAKDGHTGEPMRMEVRGGQIVPMDCAIHFAVPAAKWWDDIIFT